MMTAFTKSRIRYTKAQRLGVFAFLFLIAGLELFGIFIGRKPNVQTEPPVILSEMASNERSQDSKPAENVQLQNFDPNALTKDEWKELGFSEKQVNTIFKYKYSLGGHFSSKQQIKDCFVISDKKFNEIESFIFFGNSENYKNKDQKLDYPKSKSKINYRRFNPNEYNQKDWQNLGFSEKQALSILKYKKSLGGNFSTLRQIQDCYMISPEKFREMKPFIVLKPSGSIESKTIATIRVLSQDSIQNKPSIKLLEE